MKKDYSGPYSHNALLLFLSLTLIWCKHLLHSTSVYNTKPAGQRRLKYLHLSLPLFIFILLFFLLFLPTPPHFSPVWHPSLSGQSRGCACWPSCQAHQGDVGQQRVQTLRRNILITLHHAVVLGDAGKKRRKRDERSRGERERGECD